MILPMHKARILTACKSSAEYVMRLLSRSEGGCEPWINHRNLVQRLPLKVHDRRRWRNGGEDERGSLGPSRWKRHRTMQGEVTILEPDPIICIQAS
jgi:hypothetical protein